MPEFEIVMRTTVKAESKKEAGDQIRNLPAFVDQDDVYIGMVHVDRIDQIVMCENCAEEINDIVAADHGGLCVECYSEKEGDNMKGTPLQPSYVFVADPGHGWLTVSEHEVEFLGVRDKISACSYKDTNGNLYLEEDMDAGIFLSAYEKRIGQRPEIIEQVLNHDAWVRDLASANYGRG